MAAARGAISGTDDAKLMDPWSLERTFLLNHMIHDRRQPTGFLRVKDVLLPGIYGPTAGER